MLCRPLYTFLFTGSNPRLWKCSTLRRQLVGAPMSMVPQIWSATGPQNASQGERRSTQYLMQFSPEAFSTYFVCGGKGLGVIVGRAFGVGVQLPLMAYIRWPTWEIMYTVLSAPGPSSIARSCSAW